MPFSSLPPWLLPALILHAAMALVLLWPTWRAFSRARLGGAWALVLIVPVLGLIAVAVLLAAPVLRRAGWSPAWSVLAIVPLANVVFLWLFAYARWTRPAVEPVDEPQTVRRAEPKIAAASARGPAPPSEPTLSRPTDDGYEGLDPYNKGFVEEVDAPPEIGDIDLGEQTMVAGGYGPKKVPEEATLEPPAAREKAPPPTEADGPAAGTEEPDAAGERARPDEKGKAEEAGKDKDKPAASSMTDEMTLAAGVLSDLAAAEAAEPRKEAERDPEPEPEPEPTPEPAPEAAPVQARGGDEARTVPVRHAPAEAGNRVWTLRGVNARSANIEVTIREEDLSQSAAGILVGRSNRVDFIIGDESVSRNHARFVYQDGALCVEDLDSMNGTWVDGQALESNKPVPVGDKGEVEFGKIKLLVSEDGV